MLSHSKDDCFPEMPGYFSIIFHKAGGVVIRETTNSTITAENHRKP